MRDVLSELIQHLERLEQNLATSPRRFVSIENDMKDVASSVVNSVMAMVCVALFS